MAGPLGYAWPMGLRIKAVVIGLLAAIWVAYPVVAAPKKPHAAPTAKAGAKSAPHNASGTGAPAQDKSDQATALANAATPEDERLRIQADLATAGDYEGPPGGDFDARTLAAIKAFQKRNGGKETGLLSPEERALLTAAAARHGQTVGWRVIEDVATGAEFGLPATLVPQTAMARNGSRWTSGRGQISVETFRLPEAALAALFDSERTALKRNVEFSALKPDWFVLSGEQGLKRFVVRVQSRGSELRGITILYDQATAGTMDRVATAMADGFEGFADPSHAPPGLRRSVEYGTAIAVSHRGDFIAPARLTAQCQAIVISGVGHAERIADDSADRVALLRVYGAEGLTPVPLASDAATPDEVTVIGIVDPRAQSGDTEDGTPKRLSAHLVARAIEPVPALGFSGAAVVDPQGGFAGMLDLQPAASASADVQASLVPPQAIRSLLAAHGVEASSARGTVEQSIRRVICVRK